MSNRTCPLNSARLFVSLRSFFVDSLIWQTISIENFIGSSSRDLDQFGFFFIKSGYCTNLERSVCNTRYRLTFYSRTISRKWLAWIWWTCGCLPYYVNLRLVIRQCSNIISIQKNIPSSIDGIVLTIILSIVFRVDFACGRSCTHLFY